MEKREPPTPRKRQEARRRGHVPRSRELGSAAVIVAGIVLLRTFGRSLYEGIMDSFTGYLGGAFNPELDQAGAIALGSDVVNTILSLSLPVMLGTLAVGTSASLVLSKPAFSPGVILPRLSRLDPLQGLARIFSRRALVELAKSCFKLAAVGYTAYVSLRGQVDMLSGMTGLQLEASLKAAGAIVFGLTWKVGGILLLLGFLDHIYQHWEYETSLRMSREEFKEELRETEGQPHVRARIKERQRKIAARRMMADVPRADVVITNPTHYAVALMYRPESMPAPRVVAKGRGLIAQRIKDIAEKHRVAVVRNVYLAQALYKAVDIGQVIPERFYQAVAEVLAFVYSLGNRSRRSVP